MKRRALALFSLMERLLTWYCQLRFVSIFTPKYLTLSEGYSLLPHNLIFKSPSSFLPCCFKLWRPSWICSRTPSILLYINDLNQAIQFCKAHHFADDTNLLCLSNSIKKLNKLVNADLKHLANWLNANKVSLKFVLYFVLHLYLFIYLSIYSVCIY